MNKQLYELIMSVDFQKAEMLFMKIPDEKKMEIIEELAYDTESMIIYSSNKIKTGVIINDG